MNEFIFLQVKNYKNIGRRCKLQQSALKVAWIHDVVQTQGQLATKLCNKGSRIAFAALPTEGYQGPTNLAATNL
jgi:hypothetical protein